MSELEDLARRHLGDWRSGWSMGTFGALAEFHQDDGEDCIVDDGAGLARATARGGIRLDRDRLNDVRMVAYETPAARRERWSHGLALCLPEARAQGARRSVLTELGPDRDAIRESDREDILFDMGLSLPQCDFCIRTGDAALLAALRENAGRSLFEPGNAVMGAILAGHPHRIARTAVGRVEVYQKIGGPDTGGVSPPGPHTHLLPKLLKTGRTHSATTPIPAGLMPLGGLHPGSPVSGPMGEDMPFDPRLHHDFQALLARYGDADMVALKERLIQALKDGTPPQEFAVADNRFARATLRLALRQQARLAAHADDAGLAATIAAWRQIHDQGADADSEDDAAMEH